APALAEAPGRDLVAVASDRDRAAAGAERGLALRIVDVAGVDEAQAGGEGDLACTREGRGRRAALVEHPVIGVEGREVPGHVGTQVVGEPAAPGLGLPARGGLR